MSFVVLMVGAAMLVPALAPSRIRGAADGLDPPRREPLPHLLGVAGLVAEGEGDEVEAAGPGEMRADRGHGVVEVAGAEARGIGEEEEPHRPVLRSPLSSYIRLSASRISDSLVEASPG